MNKKQNTINELSEVLATSLASRPDLSKRLQSLLGSGTHYRGQQEEKLTFQQHKQIARDQLSALALKEKLKKQLKK
jgi:hypothetical protein